MANYISDIERRMALVELLSKTDPADALRRHHIVLQGRPDRHEQVPVLATAYVQMRLSELYKREMLRHASEA